MASVRKEIFKILCDKNIFPVGYKGYSWDLKIKRQKYVKKVGENYH